MKSIVPFLLAASLAACASTSNRADRIDGVPDPWQGKLADRMHQEWAMAHPAPAPALAADDAARSDESVPASPDQNRPPARSRTGAAADEDIGAAGGSATLDLGAAP